MQIPLRLSLLSRMSSHGGSFIITNNRNKGEQTCADRSRPSATTLNIWQACKVQSAKRKFHDTQNQQERQNTGTIIKRKWIINWGVVGRLVVDEPIPWRWCYWMVMSITFQLDKWVNKRKGIGLVREHVTHSVGVIQMQFYLQNTETNFEMPISIK